MLDRAHIENFLRLNGIEATEPDEVIRSALVGARWHEKDVEIALMVLRENVTDHTKEVAALHRVFRSDERLSPNTISSLLGVDLKLKQDGFQSYRYAADKPEKEPISGLTQVIVIALAAVGLAFILSYLFAVGPFYFPV